MRCDLHACDLPCPWPICRGKAGIADHIHEGKTARMFVCGKCRRAGWMWVPIGEPMPEVAHECATRGAVA